MDDCRKMVPSDTRQVGNSPMGNVLKTQSKGTEKSASLSRTGITSPPQIRHTSDLHPEQESEIHYIKVLVFYTLSHFSQFPLGSL